MARDKQVHLKVDEIEHAAIAAAANKAGKSVSKYLRELALNAIKCKRCAGSGYEPPKGSR